MEDIDPLPYEKAKKWIDKLKRWESKTIEYIKKNRTRVLLDLFRKNSAALVVFLIVLLVLLGNLGFSKDKSGFLFGQSSEEKSIKDNEERIQKRVKNYAARESLAVVPLAIASATEDEDITAMTLEDEEMLENQMQYQVLTAIDPPDSKELLESGADVVVYEVNDGDTVGSIAQYFDVTVNTILWANDIDDPDMIRPGDRIFVLPVTGVKHVVKDGDTIDKIAKKYKAEKENIIAFNDLPADGTIEKDQELIIPGGEIEQPRPVLQQREYYGSDVADGGARGPSIIDKNPKGGHVFPYGYCTWYVASKKYVPWGGNAGTWLYNAKAYGVKTGKKPKVGSIMVTNESWYGHVAIVEKVSGDSVTISEMNYKGWAKVSKRTISAKSRVIKGYIY